MSSSPTLHVPNVFSPQADSLGSWQSKLLWLKRLRWSDWVSVGITGLGLLAVVSGVVALLLASSSPISQEISSDVQAGTGLKLGQMTVSVTGAVAQPGLITLQEGDRVAQAVAAAGGLLPTADAAQLAKINLAQKITDGQQIHIPVFVPTDSTSAVPTTSSSPGTEQSTTISINTASQSELETLPGVGAVRAAAIIEHRPYTALSELVSKDVLSDNALTKLNGLISL